MSGIRFPIEFENTGLLNVDRSGAVCVIAEGATVSYVKAPIDGPNKTGSSVILSGKF